MTLFSKCFFHSIVLLLLICLAPTAAHAAEDWNKRMNWWGWQPDGDGLEMCPSDRNDPCVEFRKLARRGACRNISGDFENIAEAMQAERDNNLTVKFFTCDIGQPALGVMCVDTGDDGGFEACGLVGKSALTSFASSEGKAFELDARPRN